MKVEFIRGAVADGAPYKAGAVADVSAAAAKILLALGKVKAAQPAASKEVKKEEAAQAAKENEKAPAAPAKPAAKKSK